MNPSNQPLSDCHQAPVVICEGNAWDVPLESIKNGSTFGYGCTTCHERCGLYGAAQASDQTQPRTTTNVNEEFGADLQRQPELKQFNKKAFLDAAGKVAAQRAGPDAQAEVELRELIHTVLTKRHYFSRPLEHDLFDSLSALFQANKSVAVAEELQALKNLCMMPGTTVSGLNRVIGTHLARLQPPTAGEGESV